MKKTLMILLLFLCFFMITGCAFQKEKTEQKESEKQQEQQKQTEEKEPFSGEVINHGEQSHTNDMLNTLFGYGKELFDNKSYEKYQKKDGLPFISLKELNDIYGYDISMFVGDDGTICNKEESGIYFDPENTMNIQYSENPVLVIPCLVGCSEEEAKYFQ